MMMNNNKIFITVMPYRHHADGVDQGDRPYMEAGCGIPVRAGVTNKICAWVVRVGPHWSWSVSAVVTASLTVWRQAASGSGLAPGPLTELRKSWPPSYARRKEMVAMPAPEARRVPARLAGEGDCAVPGISTLPIPVS